MDDLRFGQSLVRSSVYFVDLRRYFSYEFLVADPHRELDSALGSNRILSQESFFIQI